MSNSTYPEDGVVPHQVVEIGSERAVVPAQHDLTSPHELSPGGYTGQVVAPASLVVVGGQSAGRVFPLSRVESIVGRGRNADVTVEEPSVSTRHALIRRVDTWHQVCDLGSTNGTLLNGKRLTAMRPVELHPGDTLQIANCVLVYLAEGTKEVADVTQALAIVTPQHGLSSGGALNPDLVLAQILKMSMPVEEPKISLDERVDKLLDILRVVKRFLPLIASLAAVFALGGVATVVASPPLAEASFLVTLTPQALNNPVEERSGPSSFQFFSSAESNFMNAALIETTMKSIGIPTPSEAQVDYTLKSLSFTNMSPSGFAGLGPTTYRGTFRHRSPDEAVRFLKAHVENYLTTEINKTLRVVQKQVGFLEQQTKEKEGELRLTESKLKAFRDKYLNMLPEYTEGHVTSLETLKQRQSDLKARVSAAGAAVQSAKADVGMLSGVAETTVTSAQPYKQAVADVRVKLAQARSAGLGESHPEVVRLREQVETLQGEYNKALAAGLSAPEVKGNAGVIQAKRNVALREVEAQAASAELSQVTEQIARLESIVRESPGVAEAYAELTRSYSVNTETNQRLLRELDEARVQLNAEKASAEKRYEIVLPPKTQPIPIRRTLATRAASGAGMGIGLGACIAVLLLMKRWFQERPQRIARAAIANATALRGAIGSNPSLPSGQSAKS